MFDTSHAEVARWFADGLVDGLRIDHPDGLADPAGYLGWLRELTGPDAWIVIEKILAVDEPLDMSLPVAGTTGYDALREIGGVFVDPQGAQALTALQRISRQPAVHRRPEDFVGHRDAGQRAGPAAAVHRGGDRCRPPPAGRRSGGAADPHRRLPQRLP